MVVGKNIPVDVSFGLIQLLFIIQKEYRMFMFTAKNVTVLKY